MEYILPSLSPFFNRIWPTCIYCEVWYDLTYSCHLILGFLFITLSYFLSPIAPPPPFFTVFVQTHQDLKSTGLTNFSLSLHYSFPSYALAHVKDPSWWHLPLSACICAHNLNRLEKSPWPCSWFHFRFTVISFKGLTELSGSHTLVSHSFPPPFSQIAVLYLLFSTWSAMLSADIVYLALCILIFHRENRNNK